MVKPLASIKGLNIEIVGIINIIEVINLSIYRLNLLTLSLNTRSFKASSTFFIILTLGF